jgi:hypothetical protein
LAIGQSQSQIQSQSRSAMRKRFKSTLTERRQFVRRQIELRQCEFLSQVISNQFVFKVITLVLKEFVSQSDCKETKVRHLKIKMKMQMHFHKQKRNHEN